GVCGSRLPQVSWAPGSDVEAGATVQLECQLAAEVAGPAIWLKLDPRDPNGHVLLTHGTLVLVEDPRFSVHHDQDTNTYLVKIQGVVSSDAGSYQCQVPITSEDDEDLQIQAAPPVVITFMTDERIPRPIASSHGIIAALPTNSYSLALFLLHISLLYSWLILR
ncbi:unnamed protein product, partial [Meganyctiphanes norvegica]